MFKTALKRKAAAERPRQQLPVEIIGDLMTAVRNGFYGGDEKWFPQQADIRRMVVTWPAAWLNQRGVTLSPERYKALLLGIFNDIKAFGNTGGVKYWPRYLRFCLQEHFKHHGEEIYEEAKALRNQVETALMAGRQAAEASRGADPVAAVALVHQALVKGHRRKHRPAPGKQLSLL